MRKTLGRLMLAVSAVAVAGCGNDPRPFDPRALEQIQKEAARGGVAYEMEALPATLPATPKGQLPARPTLRPVGPTVKLKLQDIIHRTAANNLDARVAGYEAAIDENRILEAAAQFDPTFRTSVQSQQQFPQGIIPNNLDPAEVYTKQLDMGLTQRLTSGGEASLTYRTARTDYDREFNVFPPLVEREKVYQNQLIFQVTQPLLRNFGAEVNRAQITIARNDQKISELEFRRTLEEQLLTVEQSYWQLVQAHESVAVLEDLVDQTERTLEILIKRARFDASDVQVTQARAQLERTLVDLVQARSAMRTLSNTIKRIMNDPDLPVASPVVIVPEDAPVDEPLRYALEDQVETALKNRAELMQQKLRVDTAAVIQHAAKNNLLPQLNAIASIGAQGLGRSWQSATDEQDDFSIVDWAIGFQFEVPLGNREAKAIFRRTVLTHLQAIDEYTNAAQQIIEQVANAHATVEAAWDAMVAARRARLAAKDALDKIETRERTGAEPQTPNWVQLKLDRQAALASARQTEIQATAAYNASVAQLERAKGTILRYDNVVLKEDQLPLPVRRESEQSR